MEGYFQNIFSIKTIFIKSVYCESGVMKKGNYNDVRRICVRVGWRKSRRFFK